MIAINKIKTLILIGPENGGAYSFPKGKLKSLFELKIKSMELCSITETGSVGLGISDAPLENFPSSIYPTG